MFKVENVKAHCDVPCGIYDPIVAQIAALSVVRMVDILEDKSTDQNKYIRSVLTKEEESQKVKNEINIIWGDFIKAPQIEKYPNIHALTHKIMTLGSANKQGVSRDKAMELLEAVNEFTQIFWEIKGVETEKITSHYLPNEEIVVPS